MIKKSKDKPRTSHMGAANTRPLDAKTVKDREPLGRVRGAQAPGHKAKLQWVVAGKCLRLELGGTNRDYAARITRDSPVSPPLTPVGRPVRDNAGINPRQRKRARSPGISRTKVRHEAIWTQRRS